MLTLNLKPIFKARGIQNPYTYLVKVGFTPSTAHNILNNKTNSFNLKHIDLLCTVLNCEPNHLIKFTPNPNQHYPENHSLFALIPAPTTETISETIASIPYTDLQKLTNTIINKETEDI